LFDIAWEAQREFGGNKTLHIISAYRSPVTNEMLRRRSSGVARNSLHTQGKALDFAIPGVSMEELRAAGLRLQRGGVGYYPGSFVHMDVGGIRHWPRMTRDQLVKVFPNERTVHVPSDGRPLSGYELASADIQRRGSGGTQMASAGNFLSKLFGGAKDEAEETEAAAPASANRVAATPRQASVAAPEKVAAALVPLPIARPTIAAPVPSKPTFQVASAAAVPVRVQAARVAPNSPNAIISSSRDYWRGVPEESHEPAELTGRAARGAPDGTATGSTSPWHTPSRNDRVPAELALAYAAQVEPPETVPAAGSPMGQAPASAKPVALASSVAKKVVGRSAPPVAKGDRFDDPWLKMLLMAPSAHNAMTAANLGPADLSKLQPMLQKPPAAVVMTFSADPYLGMAAERFSGNAVVFMSTVTFGMRTAGLR
jgi:hypothetical protein